MGKEILIVLLGIWVALQSFLGFPLWIDEALYGLLGMGILILGFMLSRERIAREGRRVDTFVERTPDVEETYATASSHDNTRA